MDQCDELFCQLPQTVVVPGPLALLLSICFLLLLLKCRVKISICGATHNLRWRAFFLKILISRIRLWTAHHKTTLIHIWEHHVCRIILGMVLKKKLTINIWPTVIDTSASHVWYSDMIFERGMRSVSLSFGCLKVDHGMLSRVNTWTMVINMHRGKLMVRVVLWRWRTDVCCRWCWRSTVGWGHIILRAYLLLLIFWICRPLRMNWEECILLRDPVSDRVNI